MKTIAILFHAGMLAVMLGNIFNAAPRWGVSLGLGALGLYSFRELKEWWKAPNPKLSDGGAKNS